MHLTNKIQTRLVSASIGMGTFATATHTVGQVFGYEDPLIASCAAYSLRYVPCCNICFQQVGSFSQLVYSILNSNQARDWNRIGWSVCEFCSFHLCPDCVKLENHVKFHEILCCKGDANRRGLLVRLARLGVTVSESIPLAVDLLCKLHVESLNFIDDYHIKLDEENKRLECEIACKILNELAPQVSTKLLHRIVSVFDNTNLYLEIENPSMMSDIENGLLSVQICTELENAHTKFGFPAIFDHNLPPLPVCIGTGHYRTIARMNHSCDPNVEWRSVNGSNRIELVAVRDIKPDEELTISYIDQSQPKETRISKLKAIYGFTCTCNICLLEA